MCETKVCTKCGQEKPLSEFGHKGKDSGYLLAQCKSCKSAYGKQWRAQQKKDKPPPAVRDVRKTLDAKDEKIINNLPLTTSDVAKLLRCNMAAARRKLLSLKTFGVISEEYVSDPNRPRRMLSKWYRAGISPLLTKKWDKELASYL